MPQYRIFTNDRGRKRGVPLYSCLEETNALTEVAALRGIKREINSPLVKAIRWPPTDPADIAWLKKHVGEN